MKNITADVLKKQFDEHTVKVYKNPPRPYLGLSSIGGPCVRQIFLQWRFARYESFPGRILRLFQRGHDEEPNFINLLRGAGYTTIAVDPNTNRQFETVQFNGHVKGHNDGFCFINNEWHLVEMKAVNNKKWLQFNRAKNVQVAEFKYYAQMQEYMYAFNTNKALFLALNKDNDHIYIEFVDRDQATHMEMQEKLLDLVTIPHIPKRCSEDPNYYICTFCTFDGICFKEEPSNRTCRMCQHVKLGDNGTWICSYGKSPIKIHIQKQLTGCNKFKELR